MTRPEDRARYVMIGGFLGAGKTTAVARLARKLSDEGRKVGLISNDQSSGLVDTAVLRSRGFSVEEIAGGCFCCRFDSLVEAADRLTQETRPEIFLAEPVGSCTDLVATVSYPLRRIYGDRFSIAPLSVLVDPARAERVLGLEKGRAFTEKVVYVYRKQLEEADAIVVNKADTLDDARGDRLAAALGREFPRARIFRVSAKEGEGLDAWFDFILGAEGGDGTNLDLDYDTYAEGEALLGWLNATVRVKADGPFEADGALLDLARDLKERIVAEGREIAHLKMTLDPGDDTGALSAVSLVSSDGEPELRDSYAEEVDEATLVLNLRAEADPALLERAVDGALAGWRERRSVRAEVEHRECFRPARPVPTHRMEGGRG